MEIKIIKGTHQIGGCITIIKSTKAKIVVDFGEDLDEAERKNLDTDALLKEIEGTNAVFITHSHGDHVGLVNIVPNHIPIFMEEMTKRIVEIGADFGVNAPLKREVKTFTLAKDVITNPIVIEDMTVTPYIVDHSSYNSCMFLIESQGKRILHTGDYRSHGRKGRLFEPTLHKIGPVDCLITEGTTLTRSEKIKYKTEVELEEEARELFKKYDQIFVLASSTNLDRIVTFYKARGDKMVVFDTFTNAITRSINFNITSDSQGIYRWNPIKYKKTKSKEFQRKYMDNTPDYGFLPNYIMFIKQSMLIDLRKLKKENMITNACLVYSMWNGYIEKEEKIMHMIKEVKKMGIDFVELHTSGHADDETMKLLSSVLKPQKTIIIHTENEKMDDLPFPNVENVKDGEIIVV